MSNRNIKKNKSVKTSLAVACVCSMLVGSTNVPATLPFGNLQAVRVIAQEESENVIKPFERYLVRRNAIDLTEGQRETIKKNIHQANSHLKIEDIEVDVDGVATIHFENGETKELPRTKTLGLKPKKIAVKNTVDLSDDEKALVRKNILDANPYVLNEISEDKEMFSMDISIPKVNRDYHANTDPPCVRKEDS